MRRIDKLTGEQISKDMENLISKRGWKIVEEYLKERIAYAAKDILLKRIVINWTAHVLDEKWADMLRKEIADCKWLLSLPEQLIVPETVEWPEDEPNENFVDEIMWDVLT